MDEAIKHLGEAFAAVFFEVDGGGDLGDGSDGPRSESRMSSSTKEFSQLL